MFSLLIPGRLNTTVRAQLQRSETTALFRSSVVKAKQKLSQEPIIWKDGVKSQWKLKIKTNQTA